MDDRTDIELAQQEEEESEIVDMLFDFYYALCPERYICKYCGAGYLGINANAGICYSADCEEKLHADYHERKRAEELIRLAELEERKAAKEARPTPPPPPAPAAHVVNYPGGTYGAWGEKRGYVYLIGSEHGKYKIGITRDPDKRFAGIQGHSPVPVIMLHKFKSDDCRLAEQRLHQKYNYARAHGEWFGLSGEEVEYIKSIRDYDLDEGVKAV